MLAYRHGLRVSELVALRCRSHGLLDFDAAWQVLTQDLKAAHHFSDVGMARAFFEGSEELPLHIRTQILAALQRLRIPTAQELRSA